MLYIKGILENRGNLQDAKGSLESGTKSSEDKGKPADRGKTTEHKEKSKEGGKSVENKSNLGSVISSNHRYVRDLRCTRCARRLLSFMCNLSRLCDQVHIGLLTKTFIILLFNSGETG